MIRKYQHFCEQILEALATLNNNFHLSFFYFNLLV